MRFFILLFLLGLLTCSSHWTAEDVRETIAESFDFSTRICRVDSHKSHLTIKISSRQSDVMDAVFEAMDRHGFIPLPDNPRVSSKNRYVLPDDIYNCYFMWYGLDTDDMMFVVHRRELWPHTVWLRAARGPRHVWYPDAFYQLLRSMLSARGLSHHVQIDTTRVLERERKFYEEYKESTGPEHLFEEYDVNGNNLLWDYILIN